MFFWYVSLTLIVFDIEVQFAFYQNLNFYFAVFFNVFESFWCVDIKNKIFKNKKNYIILIYFQVKNTLKINIYYASKYSLNRWGIAHLLFKRSRIHSICNKRKLGI
jgi:hypothetical protein